MAESDLFYLEALPEDVQATVEARNSWLKGLPKGPDGLEFLVAEVSRWNPGQAVRVAFNGGDTRLHRDVAEATEQITASCNLRLDFGFNQQLGTFRHWSSADTAHAADIRVSFNLPGFFSLVGTDSRNSAIGATTSPIGGRAHQCSLNLGNFHVQRPTNWKGVVRHEFLHALAFHHEHQNLSGPCQNEFRWDDDPGYVPTQDNRDVFVEDSAGRRPGVYTFLSGAPNKWAKAKVDHNLRANAGAALTPGAFDRESVMLYRFPALFYKSTPSSCEPGGDGINLSAGDKKGLKLLYPGAANDMQTIADRREALLQTVNSTPNGGFEGLESGETKSAVFESLALVGTLLSSR